MRSPLTPAMQAARDELVRNANWTTPTKMADAVYAAERAKRVRKGARGPAGIEIPDPTTVYRTTIDGPLLAAIGKAAYEDYRAEKLPMAVRADAARRLADDLLRRYPPADMDVLQRYGLTHRAPHINISLDGPGFHSPIYLDAPEPRQLPGRAYWYSAGGKNDHPLPDELLPFVELWISVIEAKKRDFTQPRWTPGAFKAEHHRWPRWSEIETARPAIGRWMAQQRAAS